MSKLTAIKFNWRVLLGLVALAWLANMAAHNVAEYMDLPKWVRALVNLFADLSYGGLIVLGLLGLAGLGLAAVKAVGKLDLFDATKQPEAEIITEADRITNTLDALGDRLAEIEGNRHLAISRLQDADVLASTLVGLIRRTVAKVRDLAAECEQLEAALDALVDGDQVAIARAAGALNDDHIRNLMLETNGDDRYRASLVNLMATQTGALRSQADALGELSITWIEALTRQRSQTARLVVVIDALDAARPLASIEANLQEAQRYLMMRDRPELHQVTRALPTPAAARPMVAGYK